VPNCLPSTIPLGVITMDCHAYVSCVLGKDQPGNLRFHDGFNSVSIDHTIFRLCIPQDNQRIRKREAMVDLNRSFV
jgi:hypothetical protein